MSTYTLPILPPLPDFEQSMDYWRALPERAGRALVTDAIEAALRHWPAGEGFGSSDRNHAVHTALVSEPQWAQRHYGEIADLEHRMNARGIDWDAAARLFAPA